MESGKRACIAAKFGGTSLCCAQSMKNAAAIIRDDENRRAIVVSAPGKRNSEDTKVTDSLIMLKNLLDAGENELAAKQLSELVTRFEECAAGLAVEIDIKAYFEAAVAAYAKNNNSDYLISRGEHICARLLALYLRCDFVDSCDVILFDEHGNVQLRRSLRNLQKRLDSCKLAVIPGFYGSTGSGEDSIRLFSRGGSDVTGAIVARAVGAAVYENWTDVSGVFVTDPRLVENAAKVDCMSFEELRELSCMGAAVLHGATILPLMDTSIPIHVRNTNSPKASGTIISQNACADCGRISGITAKHGYGTVTVRRQTLDYSLNTADFLARALSVFNAFSVPVEHIPLSLDTLTTVISTRLNDETKQSLESELRSMLGDVTVSYDENLSLVAVVSAGLCTSPDLSHAIFAALGGVGIIIKLIDFGSGSNSIVVGVDENNAVRAVRAIYERCQSDGYIA